MAVYKSKFKGSQIDEAVTIANANLNKGSNDTPIFYDVDGYGQAIEKDTVPTVSSAKPLTSGGAYTGLNAVVDNSDIQYENFNGEFTKVGNVQIVDGIASGFSGSNYLRKPDFIPLTFNKLVIKCKFKTSIVTNYDTVFSLFYTTSQAQKISLIFNYAKISLTSDNSVFTTLTSTSNWVANTEYSANVEIDTTLNKVFVDIYNPDGTVFYSDSTSITTVLDTTKIFTLLLGIQVGAAYPLTNGSIDLNYFSISVDGKVVYTPYPNPALPPSQNAVKQYVDNSLPAKQDTLYGGYGIDVNGATVSVSTTDVFREGDDLHEDLKVDHFGDMSVGNDSEVLAVMNEARHSSFCGVNGSGESDPKKFTKVNNPIITADGILNLDGTNNRTNYIKKSVSLFSSNNPFKLYLPIKATEHPTTAYAILYLCSGIQINLETTGQVKCLIRSGTTESPYWDITNTELIPASIVNQKQELIGVIEWTGDEYILGYIKNGAYTNVNTITSAVKPNSVTEFDIGMNQINAPAYSGSIDLKQFSVTVDGVEVFSGNKTGIDTIKPITYTPKASTIDDTLPSISDDGILKVATSGGRAISMTLPSDIESASSLKLEFDFETPSNITSTSTSMNAVVSTSYGSLSTNTIEYYINYWGVVSYLSGVVVAQNLYQGQFQNNKKYRLTLDYTNGEASCTLTPKDGTPVSSNPVAVTLSNLNGATLFFGSQAPSSEYKIDLNTIKLFVNGDLVKQGCLLIPYTQTKDGKKIVDSVYRDRVEYEYNQAGYTPYYTLSDTDYTMATVEEDDIVASLDGATSYTQRADLSIEQQGTTTSGTTVTFPKAFMDTNYALSIPYSAKTVTGFTAARDGDYIAEGYTSL